MGKANATDGSARSGHVYRHVDGFERADTLQDRFNATMCLLLHLPHRLFISRRDEIGSTECLPQMQPRFLVADQKDALGSQTFSCENATESDGSIANYRYCTACPDSCDDGRMMACRHYVGKMIPIHSRPMRSPGLR